jgi:hypothetical protein
MTESYIPIFVLALTGFPEYHGPSPFCEGKRPTSAEFHAWIAAGKPGCRHRPDAITFEDTGESVGRID